MGDFQLRASHFTSLLHSTASNTIIPSCASRSPFFLDDAYDDVSYTDNAAVNTFAPLSRGTSKPSLLKSSSIRRPRSSFRSFSFSDSHKNSNSNSDSIPSAVGPAVLSSVPGCNSSPTAEPCTTKPRRSSTISFHKGKGKAALQPEPNSAGTPSLIAPREGIDSRSSWYEPLQAERFQRQYVDKPQENVDDDLSGHSSESEEPTEKKDIFKAIEVSIAWYNAAANIPVPEFTTKQLPRDIRNRKHSLSSPISIQHRSLNRAQRQVNPSSSFTRHGRKPSLALLVSSTRDSDLETSETSDSDSEGILPDHPSHSSSTSITSPSLYPGTLSSRKRSIGNAEKIDEDLAAAIAENNRTEEDRRAREEQEGAEFLKALHQSILAEKEARALRQHHGTLGRTDADSRPSSPSTDSAASSPYISRRNSTLATVLSPPPTKASTSAQSSSSSYPPPSSHQPAIPPNLATRALLSLIESSDMRTGASDPLTPMSYNAKERPISAVREKERKSKSRSSAVTPAEPSTPELAAARPPLPRSHTSTSSISSFKKLFGRSGRNTHADNSDDERYYSKRSPTSRRTDDRPALDRRSSEASTKSTQRHRHRYSKETDPVTDYTHTPRSHKQYDDESPPKEKRRSKEKSRDPNSTSERKAKEKRPERYMADIPGSVTSSAIDLTKESPAADKKKKRKKVVTLTDILNASRRATKAAAPVEPPKLVECVTCMSDDIPEDKAATLDCGHVFCNECLVRLFNLSLTDPAHMPPKCCQPSQHIPLQHVDKLLSTKTKLLWNKKYQEYTSVNRLYCPATDCGEWIRPKDFTVVNGIKIGRCSRCKLKVCGLCGLKEHGTEECPKDEELNQVRELGKELGWQRCYSCRAMVELEKGCNHMTCRCTAEFCMICGAKWKTCECPWFNFEPDADDLPPPQLDENGNLIDDWDMGLAWENHRHDDQGLAWDNHRNDDDELVARQLAADFAELDIDTNHPPRGNPWGPLFSGAIGEGIIRLLSRTRHLEGPALERLRRAYATTWDEDFIFGDSGTDSDDERISEFLGMGRHHERREREQQQEPQRRPSLRPTHSDDHDERPGRRTSRSSTNDLDWSPRQSREWDKEDDFTFLPPGARAFLPPMFRRHHHAQHYRHRDDRQREPQYNHPRNHDDHGDHLAVLRPGEFALRRSVSDIVNGNYHESDANATTERWGDLLEGNFGRPRRGMTWADVGA